MDQLSRYNIYPSQLTILPKELYILSITFIVLFFVLAFFYVDILQFRFY